MPTPTSVDPALLARIKKLFALSQSPVPAEAETALLKAQELLLAHGLDVTALETDTAEPGGEPTVEHAAVDNGSARAPWWHKSIVAVIAPNFRCQPYRNGASGALMLIGTSTDVQTAKAAIEFAIRAAKETWSAYKFFSHRAWSSRERAARRNSYYEGFIEGISQRFAEQVKEKALVITKHQLVEREIANMNLRGPTRSRITRGTDAQARAAGYKAGRQAERDRYIGS